MTKKRLQFSKKEKKALAAIGHVGGTNTFKRYGTGHMSLIGKKGAASRWSKK